MLLETDNQTAYEEQEDVETSARELEARIRRIDGAARLMPARAYGKPIDRDAIVKSLTLRGLIAQKDRHLAAYLEFQLTRVRLKPLLHVEPDWPWANQPSIRVRRFGSSGATPNRQGHPSPRGLERVREKGKALELISNCLDHILGIADGKQRFCDTVLKVTKAFALCGTTEEAMAVTEEVAFLQAVRAPLIKGDSSGSGDPIDVNYKLQQLLSESLVAEGVMDVFKVAGLKNPDISIMSEQFLAEVAKIPQKNLAVELLQRLIKDELKTKFKTNVVKQKQFSELLTASLNKYSNRAVEAAQVIAELIEMAKTFREELERGVALGLTDAEQSFYDALANNPSAQELMKEDVLATMARELAGMLRCDATIDWQFKENVRAKLRLKIKTLLKRYKYPPDQQVTAIDLVLQQAETLSEDLVEASK